jgi:hypothetical protein
MDLQTTLLFAVVVIGAVIALALPIRNAPINKKLRTIVVRWKPRVPGNAG